MSEPLTDALLIVVCLGGLLFHWVRSIVQDAEDRAAEINRRNFGRNV
jgi:hypothetical protein